MQTKHVYATHPHGFRAQKQSCKGLNVVRLLRMHDTTGICYLCAPGTFGIASAVSVSCKLLRERLVPPVRRLVDDFRK